MKNKKKYELIDYFLFDERLSPAALKIHEAWCRDNGYKPQASSSKPQANFNKKLQAPRYKSSDYAARRAASK
jgi:hypothetical protein